MFGTKIEGLKMALKGKTAKQEKCDLNMITDNLSSEGQILRRKWNIAEIIYYFIGNGFTEIDVKIKIRENSNSVIAIYKYNSIIDFATKLLSARTSYKSYQNHHKLTTFFFPETIRDK